MSLVNYYSSSDDEKSSGDDETGEKTTASDASAAVEDTTASSSASWGRLPDIDTAVDVVEQTLSPNMSKSKPSLFSSLPAPKIHQSISEPEELDIKPSPASSVSTRPSPSTGHGFLNLPAPKKRSFQPIKITAPSLPQINSDDEEEELSAKKIKPTKTKPNHRHDLLNTLQSSANVLHAISGANHATSRSQMGLSGLFALLPKPRNASLKETNRVLLPHTLTKKPVPTKTVGKPAPKSTSSQPASDKAKLAGLARTYASDEENEDDTTAKGPSSFFSFGETSKAVSHATSSLADSVLPKWPGSMSSTLGPAYKQPDHLTVQKMTEQDTTNLGSPPISDPLSLAPSVSQDAPLSFKHSEPPLSNQDAPLSFSKSSTPAAQYGYYTTQYPQPQMYAAPYGYEYSEYNQPYRGQDPIVISEEQGASSGEVAQSSDLATDKEFQRMMGKRNISREAINMVEIAADEQIGPTTHLDWLKKNLTEEKEYRSKLAKEQLPSGQQRRKHQITYLAHQAKERELELKNQWANNRQTRKQTQMKYGF